MTQTSKIAGALIIAWIVFITTRGKLPDYLAMLGIGSGNNASGCASASSTSGTAGKVGQVATTLFPTSGSTGSGSAPPV